MMHIRFKNEVGGDHVHTRVFVGEDSDHLALAGVLRLRIGEFQLIGAALTLGAERTHGQLTVDSTVPGSDRLSGRDRWDTRRNTRSA